MILELETGRQVKSEAEISQGNLKFGDNSFTL
jgi:hypothetical protein